MNSSQIRSQLKERCLRHMVSRLEATKPRTTPYPHFWTEGIFPDDIYDRLLAELPDSAIYSRSGEGGKHYGNREDMQLLSENLEKFPKESRDLWYGVRAVLGSRELKEAIFERLSAGFSHRFSIPEDEAFALEGFPRPMLYRERAGYSIAPHPDTRRKLATVQFSLTNDPSQADLGTSLYCLSANPKHMLRRPRGFREVKRHPFVRNSVFAFSVVNTLKMRSWHGREPLPADCGTRDSLLQVYYASAADANPELLEEFQEQANTASGGVAA